MGSFVNVQVYFLFCFPCQWESCIN